MNMIRHRRLKIAKSLIIHDNYAQ